MGCNRSKPQHSEIYDTVFERYSNIVNTFGREFETVIRNQVNQGVAAIEAGPDGGPSVTIDSIALSKALATMLEQKKYRLRSIPRHVWAELLIASISNNFVQPETVEKMINQVYNAYLERDCLVATRDAYKRFSIEHESFLTASRKKTASTSR